MFSVGKLMRKTQSLTLNTTCTPFLINNLLQRNMIVINSVCLCIMYIYIPNIYVNFFSNILYNLSVYSIVHIDTIGIVDF